jgi:hypothetical protein
MARGSSTAKKPDNPVIPNQLRIGNPMLLTSGRRDSVGAGESLDDDRSLAARKCDSQEYRRGVGARFPDPHRGVPQLQLAVAILPKLSAPPEHRQAGRRIFPGRGIRRHAETSEPIPCPSLRAKQSRGRSTTVGVAGAPHIVAPGLLRRKGLLAITDGSTDRFGSYWAPPNLSGPDLEAPRP